MGYTPDEIIQQFELLGYGSVSRSTLVRDARAGLIPAPEVRSLGRGMGVSSIYPREALAEFVAARLLVGTLFPSKPLVLGRVEREKIDPTSMLARILEKKGWQTLELRLPPKRVTREDVKRIRARAYEMSEAEQAAFEPDLSIERGIVEVWDDVLLAEWLRIREEVLKKTQP